MRFKAKRSPEGSSSVRGRLGLAVLVAAVAAFFVVPVAQAAASGLKVNLAGTGEGTIKTLWQADGTEPPIECSGPPASGTCTQESPPANGEAYYLMAIPAPGSTFTGASGWTIETGVAYEGVTCNGSEAEKENVEIFAESFPEDYEGAEGLCIIEPSGGNAKLTATFTKTGPVTPTKLTVLRTGEGTIASSPAGIECGATCSHEFEINEAVTLTASPASGWAFSSWSGCATKPTALTCKVTMDKAKTVKATFVATPSLAIEKAGTGQGKVSATGINCDENCSKASSAIKTGTLVTVKTTPAKGSEVAVFESGTGNASACSGSCVFTISENSSVKVKFNAIPTKALTVNLTGDGKYKGKVTGKGIVKGLTAAAINCGSGCTTQTEAFFQTDEVTLTVPLITGYTFAGWSLTAGTNAGTCTGTTTPCIVPTSSAKTLAAEFK